MPMYDFRCPACGLSREDEWFHMISDAPLTLPCECGFDMARQVAAPVMMLPYNERPPITGAKNIWEGTRFADSDGKNRAHYKSDRIQVDMGSK